MRTRLHPAWVVAAITTVTLLLAAAFRSTTGVLIYPIEMETGWSRNVTSGGASLNLIVYGIAAPFTAALMQVWGVRKTVCWSLVVVAAGGILTAFVSQPWQLWVLWGVLIGVGTGSMALTFGTIIANRWFFAHRSLVTGIFSAATAAGQVIFVPVISALANSIGWRSAVLVIGGLSLLNALAALWLLRDRPSQVGVAPLGASSAMQLEEERVASLTDAITLLVRASRRWPFWVLMLTFFVCGWSTNGIVVTHLAPAAHDHGMPVNTAAVIIGIIGIFDIIGTVASGWLTDKYDPRKLLAIYYVTRGISLCFINGLLGPGIDMPLWAFIIFYGLDWTATVPPTVELCRRHFGLQSSGVLFGWIYASHMVGAGIGASVSGFLRSQHGTYELAWILSAVLCVIAGVLALTVKHHREVRPAPVS